MTEVPHDDDFYTRVPVFRDFASVTNPALYEPVPDDWTLGLADVVESTKAIAHDRYKTVNMAGAAVIASVGNALGRRKFPYVFGGDGASFAVAPCDVERARQALAATATWAAEELALAMRVAMVPVARVRTAGCDVRVARFAQSDSVAYAMFSGGGLCWADAAMKRGEFAIDAAPSGSRPSLDGLSCRFAELPARRGTILSMVVMPAPNGDAAAFRSAIEDIVVMVEKSPDKSRPVPRSGLAIRSDGIDLEARATRGSKASLWKRKIGVRAFTLIAWAMLRFRIGAGAFDPARYLAQVVENSDFRKFDDGLRMILDCAPSLADAIEARLERAAGAVRYGLHRQDAALMTCFVPSYTASDHVHFVDGARGGYATAAAALKARAGRA
ncbi:MAG TPA: DUF3095 domain-containing protein [Casimicrobiaceae bacterium]|nr:DUF3095 domain-containing protein [Casimicrobiaceae bacterium]